MPSCLLDDIGHSARKHATTRGLDPGLFAPADLVLGSAAEMGLDRAIEAATR
jgi:hypothetical protein